MANENIEIKQITESKEIIEPKPVKPNHGWSYEHDELLAIWGDKAGCYTWMHDATQRKFKSINMRLGIPVIVLSTISGTANFGISTIFPPGFTYGNAVIGCLSLITGVISTVSNFLGYAQSEEAHRIASIQWAKFRRSVETELALSPLERTDALEFIKQHKSELDRLMEQNPVIPQDVIDNFKKVFKKNTTVAMPEICNKLDHTVIYIKREGLKPTDPKNSVDQQISELISDNTTEKNIVNKVNQKLNLYVKEKPLIIPFNPLIKPKKIPNSNESESDEINEVTNVINYTNDTPKIKKSPTPKVKKSHKSDDTPNKNVIEIIIPPGAK
jgi:hypothetical protein